MSEQIPVSTTSTDNYTITVGSDLSGDVCEYVAGKYGTRKVLVLIDHKVYKLHSEDIESALDNVFEKVVKFVIPEGESSKSLEQFTSLMDLILKEGVERKTPLLAIGGGVVGDLAGFVAASVLRGIPLIHIPTTLLAMVDSSIGGKTGINHSTGKNLIGAFYQPKAVFADVSFLKTLPREQWVNGLSEIIKYGMIEAPEILNSINELIDGDKFSKPGQWIPIIKKSAEIKADIVNRDVKEAGVREYLNFGHTFAHVIETKGNYTRYSHGEAVFAGMFGAVHASNQLGTNIDIQALKQFKHLYSIHLDAIKSDPSEFTQMMLRDKKAKDNTVRLVLLEYMGKPMVRSYEDASAVDPSWEYIFKEFK